MTYRINFLFLFIAELLDVLFGTLFPSDLLKMSTSIIFQFQFIALILIGRKLNKFDDFILAFILGCYNSLHLGYFSFVIGLIYWVVLYLVKQIFPNGNESLIEYVIILLLAIFIKEGMLYGYMLYSSRTKLEFINWLVRRGIPTLIGNIIPIIIMIIGFDFKEAYILRKEKAQKINESLFFKGVEVNMKNKKRI